MAIYRCKRSGNLLTVTNAIDIETMKGNMSYEEVNNAPQPNTENPISSAALAGETAVSSAGDTESAINKPDAADRESVAHGKPKNHEVMPLRHNGKVDKRSKEYRLSIGKSK